MYRDILILINRTYNLHNQKLIFNEIGVQIINEIIQCFYHIVQDALQCKAKSNYI